MLKHFDPLSCVRLLLSMNAVLEVYETALMIKSNMILMLLLI